MLKPRLEKVPAAPISIDDHLIRNDETMDFDLLWHFFQISVSNSKQTLNIIPLYRYSSFSAITFLNQGHQYYFHCP